MLIMIERPTEKPGAMANPDVGLSPRCSIGFFSQSPLSVQILLLSYSVHTASLGSCMHQHVCEH